MVVQGGFGGEMGALVVKVGGCCIFVGGACQVSKSVAVERGRRPEGKV